MSEPVQLLSSRSVLELIRQSAIVRALLQFFFSIIPPEPDKNTEIAWEDGELDGDETAPR